MADFVITFSGGNCFTNGVLGLPTDWSCDAPGNRIVAGNNIPPGTYYTTGNINISGNPGTPGSPISLSLVAGGYVDISGTLTMNPSLSAGGVSYAVVAGTDLGISGNPANPLTGVFYARHQFKFNGNPVINGQVIGADEDDFGTPINLVERLAGGFMEISGNVTINAMASGSLSMQQIAGWREVRQ